MTDLPPPADMAAIPLENLVAEQASEAPPAEAYPGDLPEDTAAAAAAVKEPFWYRQEMRKEKHRREALERENEQLRVAVSQPQYLADEPDLPDPNEDPYGYAAALQWEVQAQLQSLAFQQNLAISERFARQQHGDDQFNEANDWLHTRPDVVEWAQGQSDPWGAAIAVYAREKLAAEIGDSPEQWRERERERLRAEILADAQSGHAGDITQRPLIPGPGSQARSAAPRAGAWTGPTPLAGALKNSF
jgi:hypothetical protein